MTFVKFCEKLDFLMNVSNISNSQLAKNVKLDPSHISRLRRGKRGRLKSQNVLKMMANYFAKHCCQAYQRKTLSDVLDTNITALVERDIAKIILNWLSEDMTKSDALAETFLNNMSNFSAQTEAIKHMAYTPAKSAKSNMDIYYGINGKRQAVERFLSEVIYANKSQTLLLYSDEPTDWMTADREFAFRWASLMSQILSQGNKIKIIHNVSRNFDEMLDAISQWMPLYMSGAIEPYYYPKKRDGLFKRTLFIAPKTAALVSNSIADTAPKAANFYFNDDKVIASLVTEFTTYNSMCRQLMKIFTSIDTVSFVKTLLEFEKNSENSIIISESLSLVTMPQSIKAKLIKNNKNADIDLKELDKQRIANFENQLKTNAFTEIIKIQDPQKIKKGEVRINLSDMPDGKAVYYTLEDYICHLENILAIVRKNNNYRVYLTDKSIAHSYTVYVRENLGAIIVKTSSPAIAIAFNESNLAAGFWDYLKSFINEKKYRNSNKKKTATLLKNYIDELKQQLKN